jgi:CheY-like chemotaxis protein
MSSTITIADDSMFARMLLKEAVSKIFNDTVYIDAVSGQQVLDRFSSGTVSDWYLLDVNMGKPNGLDTAKHLIEQGIKANKILLVTSNKSSELQKQADAINLSYINKAMGPSDLEALVKRLKPFFNC